jgi:bisphosphoglycerate-independent phosphoglycerate mutase (AlkP superfamily)
MTWFRTEQHEVHDEPVDLESVAPTVLALLGVPKPKQMTGAVLPVGDVTTRT